MISKCCINSAFGELACVSHGGVIGDVHYVILAAVPLEHLSFAFSSLALKACSGLTPSACMVQRSTFQPINLMACMLQAHTQKFHCNKLLWGVLQVSGPLAKQCTVNHNYYVWVLCDFATELDNLLNSNLPHTVCHSDITCLSLGQRNLKSCMWCGYNDNQLTCKVLVLSIQQMSL